MTKKVLTVTRTKKFKLGALICTLLSIVLSIGPLVVYSVMAFNSAGATTVDKVTLLSMISVGTILSLVCAINKYTPRCRLWLILIGLYVCLDSFIGCVLVMAITQCADELIVHPLAKYFRSKYSINKEIDKRL